ncbi:MAG: gliding motility-associated C-terminal domain-containing protein [Bacteroidetes bacterium]|nr:gliding motility-associated C-terminal domain-containing protein [Bacteroidota bacterium]
MHILTLRKLYIITILFLLSSTGLFSQGNSFYWIGGSGNWSDTLHWLSENGGLPSVYDNVYFNANSFNAPGQTLTIDIQANCHNMNWSDVSFAPELAGSSDLNLAGSLYLNPQMEISYDGQIYFSATGEGHEIRTAGHELHSDLIFIGTATWNLLEPLDAGDQAIQFNRGNLNMAGHTIRCGDFYSATNYDRSLLASNSQVILTKDNSHWEVNDQLVFDAANSSVIFEFPGPVSENVFSGGGLHYAKVEFKNNGYILGNNSFENLVFAPACTYRMSSGSTQTITNQLKARGCSGLIRIEASGASTATIAKNNGPINLAFVILKGIQASMGSGFQFNAFYSIDDGNNQNINILSESRTLTWMNGTGFWSDTLHWSSSVGGEESDCLPLPIDKVIFNELSFSGQDTVKVDQNELALNSFTWLSTDPAVLKSTSPDPQLLLYGSLHLNEAMTNAFNGPLIFADSLGGQTIKTGQNMINGDLFFSGQGGSWSLIDSLKVAGSIHFLNGELNAADRFIQCQTFHSDSAFSRTLQIENSAIKILGASPYPPWSFNNEGLELNATGSIIEFIASSPTFANYGGDTVFYENIRFSGANGTARINTDSDTYVDFGKVEFAGNGTIVASNAFDTLSFSPGSYYDLSPGSTQKIRGAIYPSGNCFGSVLLKSATNGSIANLEKENDTLFITNVALRDISVGGGAIFIAENSIDLGNNIGWDTIQVTAPGKLYWVNDGGNWSDSDHWAYESGGQGGACIPTPYDTVIIDQNSFVLDDQLINIDQNNAFAHNLDWSGLPDSAVFSGSYGGSYLRIYGSLQLHPMIDFTYPGFISFEATQEGQTIQTENVKFHNYNNNVYFDGRGGSWTLQDSLLLGVNTSDKNAIQFLNGNLNTNGQFIRCFGFYSRYGNERSLQLDDSKIFLGLEWYMNGDSLSLPPNTSYIQIDSGQFLHKYGSKAYYHNIRFTSPSVEQIHTVSGADSIVFQDVIFESEGQMVGTNSRIYAAKVEFQKNGKINEYNANNVNTYSLDSLIFNAAGAVYGNDTVSSYLLFDSTAIVDGNGVYHHVVMNNDGNIAGINHVDTLIFTPGYSYFLQSGDSLKIKDYWEVRGNNCEFVYLQATAENGSYVLKESGMVQGEHIQMARIHALGGANFDAGSFSEDINGSNTGWIFHENPLKYKLDNDTTIMEGESITLCASRFNGNTGTSYEWKNCETGEIVGTDSCITLTSRGYYCLTVHYDEGTGCTKTDTISLGCFLDVAIQKTNVTCNGFSDGAIEMDISVGQDPIEFEWYKDGVLYANSKDIYNLEAGYYVYDFLDAEGCASADSVEITEPVALAAQFDVHDACFDTPNGMIAISVQGGTQPYDYQWASGRDSSYYSNLLPGEYDIIISDSNNCPGIEQTIVIGEMPAIDFALQGTDLDCFEGGKGAINVLDLTGGTGSFESFTWTKEGDLFSLDSVLSNLQAGEYHLTVADDWGCTGHDAIILTQPPEIVLTLNSVIGEDDLGSIDLSVDGGMPPYTYLWNTGATTQDVDPLGGGDYTVVVNDANNCKSSETIFVEVHFRVLAPTAFSPNGDGLNDKFEIHGLGTDLKAYDLTIYNRFGDIVFETDNPETNWNGLYLNTGEPMPTEVYIWVAKLSYTGGESIIDKGTVTLLK